MVQANYQKSTKQMTMVNYIKKNGVPEQYPIMMLVGFRQFGWSWPWQMAKGQLKKWFWNRWEYWEMFEDHDVQVHYRCWRFCGIQCKTMFQVQPSSDFPHPYDCFSYKNNGYASYETRHNIMTFGYPSGEHYPKGTKVEADIKEGGLWLDESRFLEGD